MTATSRNLDGCAARKAAAHRPDRRGIIFPYALVLAKDTKRRRGNTRGDRVELTRPVEKDFIDIRPEPGLCGLSNSYRSPPIEATFGSEEKFLWQQDVVGIAKPSMPCHRRARRPDTDPRRHQAGQHSGRQRSAVHRDRATDRMPEQPYGEVIIAQFIQRFRYHFRQKRRGMVHWRHRGGSR